MSKWFQLALLIAGGVLLAMYVRRRQLANQPVRLGEPGKGGTTPTVAPKAPPIQVTIPGSDVPIVYTPAPSTRQGKDVAPSDLDENERDVFLDNRVPFDTRNGNYPASVDDWMARFWRQVYHPASRLSCGDLTELDMKRAVALISGQLTRPLAANRRDLMSDAELAQASQNDLDATFRPLYDAIRGIMYAFSAITFGITGIIAGVADLAGAGNAIDAMITWDKLRAGLPPENLAAARKWLGSPLLLGSAPVGEPLRFPAMGRRAPDGTGYYERYQLFTQMRGAGWNLAWNAVELTSTTSNTLASLRERINIRARVYKAIDLICCELFPYTLEFGEGKTEGDHEPDGLYIYYTQGAGKICGSIFPHHLEAGEMPPDGLKAIQAAASSEFTPYNPAAVQSGVFTPPAPPVVQLTTAGGGTIGSFSGVLGSTTTTTTPPLTIGDGGRGVNTGGAGM
ncbi:MAG TPA: hypothetical protein VF814_04610 [Casimicrobiaceae bacterium]